ncbi:alpha/beta hydrolase [Shimia thalassica]|uniref:alpha/beta hydrolase n=1 Tax=Shimia thalassica TaxID=1715693 RepID=UPI0026E362A5|nr:alpha/beta hydrolase [Shimia thalassica]MDO6484837.1 alpha/beta hydrolase [Shimia thalassica]
MRAIPLIFALSLLMACTDRTPAPLVPEAANIGDIVPVYVATNRARNDVGYFSDKRASSTTFLLSDVSMPPERKEGEAPIYSAKPNPNKHFALVTQKQFSGEQAFVQDIRRQLTTHPAAQREVVLYVHGYFNGYADTVFRVAQMKSDFDMPGLPMVFSWPSAGHPAGYTYDRESALFARDALEQTLYLLHQTGAKIQIVGHSMGGLLVMETLRQIEIAKPGWSNANIDGVAMISPDISVDVFHEQAARIKKLPSPFLVVTSEHDRALLLSSRLNNHERLGLGSDESLANLPITFLDVSDFSKDSGNSHFVILESPALIAMLEGASLHSAFTKDRSRSMMDRISETQLSASKAVVYELSPEEALRVKK